MANLKGAKKKLQQHHIDKLMQGTNAKAAIVFLVTEDGNHFSVMNLDAYDVKRCLCRAINWSETVLAKREEEENGKLYN